MTYHKRAATPRACAHCETVFHTTHKSRRYCCQSCNTLAWRARQANAAAPRPAAAAGDAARQTLAFSLPNVALLALGSTVGTLAAQGVTALGQHLLAAPSEIDQLRAEMRAGFAALGAPPAPEAGAGASWLPAPLRAQRAPALTLYLREGEPSQFVRLAYHGHTLYHCPDSGLVFWERGPNQYRQLASAAALAALPARPALPHPTPPPAAGDLQLPPLAQPLAQLLPNLDLGAALDADLDLPLA